MSTTDHKCEFPKEFEDSWANWLTTEVAEEHPTGPHRRLRDLSLDRRILGRHSGSARGRLSTRAVVGSG